MPHHVSDGPDDAASLVLSPSLGATLAMWEPQLSRLAGQLRVVRYDHRGHGGSPVPDGPYSIAELGGDVLELADRLGLERFSFCRSNSPSVPRRARSRLSRNQTLRRRPRYWWQQCL